MQLVPAYGPWFMTYSPGRRTFGVMLALDGQDIALSGGVFGWGLILGWRTRRPLFGRRRRFVLGRER